MIGKNKKLLNGTEVNPIGIGTWGIGGFMEAEYGKENDAAEAIKYSIKKGQNLIDTAQMYGNGHAEEIVGQAIKGVDRKKIVITSKVHRNYSKSKDVVRSVEDILKRLGTDYLDILYIHAYWEDEDMKEWLSGVNSAEEKGLTKAIAVSNFNTEQLKWAELQSKNPIVANQMNYNILHQIEVPERMKDYCLKENIMIVAYRPVERKLLADQCTNMTVINIAKKYGKTPAQIALNWLISQNKVVAIPKSVHKEHIDENLGALDFEMDKVDTETLNHES